MATISLIIPTYNAQDYLHPLLDMLSKQSLPVESELLIIDSSSGDKTVEIAREFTENITIIPQNEFDHGGTRTKAARMAKGDILVFLTARKRSGINPRATRKKAGIYPAAQNMLSYECIRF